MKKPDMKNALLVVDLFHAEAEYHNPKTIGSYLLGKRLTHYALFKVDKHTWKKEEIFLPSAEVSEIQKHVNSLFEG